MKNLAAGSMATPDNPEEQVGQTISTTQDGIRTITRTLTVQTDTPGAHIPAKHTPHPESNNFWKTTDSAIEVAPGTWQITLNYSGPADPTAPVETHRFQPDTVTSPIPAHPRYTSEMEMYAKTTPVIDSKTGETYERFDFFPASGGALEQRLSGTTAWKDPRLAFIRTIVVLNTPGALASDANFFNLGRFYTTAQLNQMINGMTMPVIPGEDGYERNWLLVRAPIEFIGAAIRITQTFELSGPFGVNPIIYRAAGS